MRARTVASWVVPLGLVALAIGFARSRPARDTNGASAGPLVEASVGSPAAVESGAAGVHGPCESMTGGAWPPAEYRTPLPGDSALAEWTARIESSFDAIVRLRLLGLENGKSAAAADPRAMCVASFLRSIDANLPEGNALRDRAHELVHARWPAVEPLAPSDTPSPTAATKPAAEPDGGARTPSDWIRRRTHVGPRASRDGDACTSTSKYLEPFPRNARLERALLLHFSPCVEDNFNSIDGPLDSSEPLLRATALAVPNRVVATFDYLAASARVPFGFGTTWDDAPFGRIPLDRGPSGNALRVVGELVRNAPETRAGLVESVRRNGERDTKASRGPRWKALLAYLEAGAPDVDERKPAELVAALDAGGASRRWALGILPNQLEEHAPVPPQRFVDANLKSAVERFAQSATDATDVALMLDVVARMAPGTALAAVAEAAGSGNVALADAALDTLMKWVAFAPNGAASKAMLAPALATLRAALGARACDSKPALEVLAAAGDPSLDESVASCVRAAAELDSAKLQSIFVLCTSRREFGWSETANALETHRNPGNPKDYAKRVANGCRTGRD